jgi:hypothetical protein
MYANEKMILPSPESFSDVSRDMKTPCFWISKIQNPDKIILSKEEPGSFNKDTKGKNDYIKDIFNLDLKTCNIFTKKDSFSILKKYKNYYNSSLKRVGSKYIESILNNIDYDYSEGASFAITVKSSYLRALPTQDPLYSSTNSTNLYRLQIAQIDFASPLIVWYSTIDKEWYYVISEICDGWISADPIVFGLKKDIENYKKLKDIVVVISKQSDLLLTYAPRQVRGV